MRRTTRSFASLITVLGVALAACGEEAADAAPGAEAVSVTEIEDSDLHRVTLSESAAARLGVETVAVTEGSGGRLLIPYSALLYDAAGATWTYTNLDDRVFVREQVEVELIDGDVVQLTVGPEPGTTVVTVGAAELWGAETGVGGGH